jgi:hypothetical protein
MRVITVLSGNQKESFVFSDTAHCNVMVLKSVLGDESAYDAFEAQESFHRQD